jgi:hypothetical protein
VQKILKKYVKNGQEYNFSSHPRLIKTEARLIEVLWNQYDGSTQRENQVPRLLSFIALIAYFGET